MGCAVMAAEESGDRQPPSILPAIAQVKTLLRHLRGSPTRFVRYR
ncbi:MAG: hypothetical protein AAFX78_11435 [Cyanobacteria bacterium J06638_20]